jgi:glycosyltransferase involved in cell wall biosynthesis
LRILVLSPYQARSHRIWIDQLVAGFPDIDWRVLALPARHFAWRVRSNPLSWYLNDTLAREPVPDLLLATSMTDLATLKGLFQPRLGNVPAIVYFHENQFAYPLAPGAVESVEPAMVNLYSALAADRVVFNSKYNRDTFLAGALRFLARMPDALPVDRLRDIADTSEVIPVPVRDVFFDSRRPAQTPPRRLIWNHRWEYDKGPDRLLAAVAWLAGHDVDCTVELMGQRFRRAPPAFDELLRRFPARVRDRGCLAEPDYVECLAAGGFVLSTALHDFQGLAMMEAAAAGCVPVLPERLAYPEWFDETFRYASLDDPGEEGRALGRRIAELLEPGAAPQPPCLDRLRFRALAQRYRALFTSLV